MQYIIAILMIIFFIIAIDIVRIAFNQTRSKKIPKRKTFKALIELGSKNMARG